MFLHRLIHPRRAPGGATRWPASALAGLLALTGVNCDDPEDELESSIVSLERTEQEPARASRAEPPPRQVTVYEEDELDRSDPTVLQVRAPRGKEAWVLAGARALLDQVGESGELEAAVQAQRLMADIAAADATVVVTVSGVSSPVEPELVPPMHDVVFTHVQTIHGSPTPSRWQVRLADGLSCGPPLPEPGSTWLAFVRVRGDHVTLTFDHPLRALVDGVLVDSGPLSVRPAALAAAALAARKEVSP